MWQSTGHQQVSLKVETFRLPFWPPLLTMMIVSILQICIATYCFIFRITISVCSVDKILLMLEALWFSDYTLSWESELLSLSFSFCISPVHNVGDTRDEGLTPGSGRSPGEGNGNPPQYSCLEDPMDKGATVHRVTESDATDWLNNRRNPV